MIKYVQATITPESGVEKMATVPLVSGVAGASRRVTGIYTKPTNTLHLRAYWEAERIADIDANLFTYFTGFVALDVPLGEGEQFKLGLYSTSGTTAQYVLCRYEE